MPPSLQNLWPWAAVLTVGLVLCGCVLAQPRPSAASSTREVPAAQVDRFGDLEVVTHARHYRSANYGTQGTTHDWSLRWRGQPLLLQTRGGMFGDTPREAAVVNAVFVLGEGEAAELIVNVGDPNNTSAFHLLRQQDGALQTPLLCVAMASDNQVRWLDPATASAGSQTIYSGPRFERLAGQGLLALGSQCLYDTHSRQVVRLPKAPDTATVVHHLGAVAQSPDGRSIVYLGTEPDGSPYGKDCLMVADLAGQRWHALAIDRGRMRYAKREVIDAAWVMHHFEWRGAPGGPVRLAERARFEPLPRKGSYYSGQSAQYTLEDTLLGARHRLVTFLQQRFGAVLQPLGPYSDGQFLTLMWRGHPVVVSDSSVHIGSPIDAHKVGYQPGQPGDPALAQQLIHELGDAIDAELAAGRLQDLFDGPSR